MPAYQDIPGKVFLGATVITAFLVAFLIGFIFVNALPTYISEGPHFITGTRWSYDTHEYGIWLFIGGTLVLTAVTIVLAVPLGVLAAVYLSEWAPRRVEKIFRPLIELLVGIPSVVYGLFGVFLLAPFFRDVVDPALSGTLGFIPIFRDATPGLGLGVLLAATVLTIMILPTIIALSEEAMRAVPAELREASFALGATRWETVRRVVIPAAFAGIVTAVVLGMMRALGETMAVVMLTGNGDHIPTSLLDTGYAMTSKILNDIGYRFAQPEARSALIAIAGILFLIEIIFVGITRFISGKARERSGH